jgi:ABC-type multidrug transport system ATPase subunit
MNPFDGPAVEFVDVWYHASAGPQLRGLTFSLARGEAMGLAGSPDAGASLVIDLLLGWQRPTRGTVRVLGRSPHQVGRVIAYEVGAARRRDGLDDRLSVKDNLLCFADLYRLFIPPKYLADLLARIGLGGRGRERAASLSALDRRRLALARAMLPDPSVLALEEFLDDLAAGERREIEEILAGLAQDGKAILVTSSAEAPAALLGPRAALLSPA